MAQIYGTVIIDFETDTQISEEQYEIFKCKIQDVINSLDTDVYHIAAESGFNSSSVPLVTLDELECYN